MKHWKKLALSALAIVALVGGTAGSCGNNSAGDAAQNDPQAKANFSAQKKNDPVPVLNDSLERGNIVEHLKRNNQADRVRYIYLLADTGGIYAYFVIKGKVTSTAAQLTPTDDLVDICGSGCYELGTVQGPTDDGSFGGDEGGVYFFTDLGVEIQWNGRWLLTDQPLKINTPTLTLTQK